MEVDEANNESKTTEVQNVLLLPQADAQPNDLSVYTDSTSSSRRTKRKRSEFAEFSDFVSKRRSTRVYLFFSYKDHFNYNSAHLFCHGFFK